ncbi:lipoprotein insertase outer membrane protein LolB [Legionella parisiensis]|uniref:Outer-membrane lipoprotein LolB n=1 Tax=Legionella parisiensis TaxID=45071 RepID=A0A1E5JNE7_9GAMM|nr:lipoprotein insertase outer membrane protein LolB [Legionella parisiensis]KTD44238.1 molecular chaperone LolB [Legionella parisiensis]OEH46066.1 Outer-membrane lipoprotein LolB [Legionella parisiensis]STX71862.1 molecular chaperone LolB [Legionella parisiensis]
MNNMKRLVIIPFCFLTACAPPRPAGEVPLNKNIPLEQNKAMTEAQNKVMSVEQRKAKTAMVSSFEIRGSMAAKNKNKGWSAAMNWKQSGSGTYQIRLMGPLGAGTVLIDKKGNTITFQDGPKKITSHSPDQLLAEQTGIRLPVNNLYYWVRGLPAPGPVQAEKHDEYNHLVQLRQSGYTINFAKYTSVRGIDLPSMIRLEGNGVMVKVAIQNWTV